MAERRRDGERPMPTIWRVPDGLWEKIEPILPAAATSPAPCSRATRAVVP